MAHQDVVALALSMVGAKEEPKGSNSGPQVDLWTGGRKEAHCSHFVAWLFRQCGKAIPGDVVPSPKRANPLASVAHLERVFKEHDWLVREPAVGDVVFYLTRGKSDAGPGRHTGVVVAVSTTHFETVEANWGDRVAHRTVSRADPSVAGFGRRP